MTGLLKSEWVLIHSSVPTTCCSLVAGHKTMKWCKLSRRMRAISNVRGLEQFAPQLNPISGRSKVTVIWAVILRSIRPPPPVISKSYQPNLAFGVSKCLLGSNLSESTFFCFYRISGAYRNEKGGGVMGKNQFFGPSIFPIWSDRWNRLWYSEPLHA